MAIPAMARIGGLVRRLQVDTHKGHDGLVAINRINNVTVTLETQEQGHPATLA
jgi:hypothetical protein